MKKIGKNTIPILNATFLIASIMPRKRPNKSKKRSKHKDAVNILHLLSFLPVLNLVGIETKMVNSMEVRIFFSQFHLLDSYQFLLIPLNSTSSSSVEQ